MPLLFVRMHAAQALHALLCERTAAPSTRSMPSRVVSTTESEPWMYDWLAKGSEW
jgi:hypothetical protein